MTTSESVRVMSTWWRVLGLAALAAATSLNLSGCSNTIKPEGAAKSVTEVVSEETGFEPTDVKCPSGVEAAVDVEFECTFTGPDGDYVAHVRITKVDGEDVEFFIETEVQP